MHSLPIFPPLYRKAARDALKPNLATALMVCFLASLPTLLTSMMTSIAGKQLSETLRYYLLTFEEQTFTGALSVPQQLEQFLATAARELQQAITPTLKLAWGLSLAAALLSPVLMLGVTTHLLKLLRGEQGELRDVISRLGSFFKAILLNLLIWIKSFLWMLPGMVISIGASLLVFQTDGVWPVYLYGLGFVLILVPGIRAMLHYILAPLILADEPSTGVLQCIRSSTAMMRTHKLDFVRLRLSFILWELAATMVTNMFSGLSAVLGITVNLAAQLGLSLYINATTVVFYLVMKGEKDPMSFAPGLIAVFPGQQQPGGSDDRNDGDDDDDDMLN